MDCAILARLKPPFVYFVRLVEMDTISVVSLSDISNQTIMSSARQYHPKYTFAEYMQWEGNWELLYGTAVSMSPSPFGPHKKVVAKFVSQIDLAISIQKCKCVVYAGLDWIIQCNTVVRPDVMVVCGEQPPRHLERPPTLAIEVLSDSTSDKDRTVKRELYESQCVEHYLIVDPVFPAIQWLSLMKKSYYTDRSSQISLAEPFAITLDNGCNLLVDPRVIFS